MQLAVYQHSSAETMSSPVRPSPFAVIADMDGSPVITHSKSKAYWKLDRSALLVWRGIMQRRSVEGICASLVYELALTERDAERVVEHVIDLFRANDLVVDNV
jgi:hypothetical protein